MEANHILWRLFSIPLQRSEKNCPWIMDFSKILTSWSSPGRSSFRRFSKERSGG